MKRPAICSALYDAFNAADIDTLTELFDEDVVWHLPGRSSMADDYQGRDATLAYFGQIGERDASRPSYSNCSLARTVG